MVAGHILIKILIYSLLSHIYLSILIIPILLLELLVGILQAYIYFVLVISYYKDISIPH